MQRRSAPEKKRKERLAQEIPSDDQQVLTTLAKPRDFKDQVLKVNVPRNDVAVTIEGVKAPTPFGFGGWVAMTKGTGRIGHPGEQNGGCTRSRSAATT